MINFLYLKLMPGNIWRSLVLVPYPTFFYQLLLVLSSSSFFYLPQLAILCFSLIFQSSALSLILVVHCCTMSLSGIWVPKKKWLLCLSVLGVSFGWKHLKVLCKVFSKHTSQVESQPTQEDYLIGESFVVCDVLSYGEIIFALLVCCRYWLWYKIK